MNVPVEEDPMGTLGAEPPLPAGFKRALYLRSSGAQYIETGVKVTPQTKVFLDIEFLESNASGYNGAVLSMPLSRFTVAKSKDYTVLTLACGQNESRTGIDPVNKRLKIEMAADGTAKINGTAVPLDSDDNIPNVTFWLFGRHQTVWADTFPCTQKLYGFKMWQGGTMVRNMVPAVRISDGKPCMVDLLTGSPYYNKRNGADFTTDFDE